MGKRAASTVASPTKAAKAARTETEGPQGDQFLAACAPLLELLSQADDLSGDCKEMLQALAPHCLRTAKAARHKYQEQMIESLASVVASVVAAHESAVASAEATLSETLAAKAESVTTVAAAQEAADIASGDLESKATAVQAALEAVTAAQAALGEAQKKVGSLESEKAEAIAEKADFEKLLTETFDTLKQGSIASKDWRQKAKLVEHLLERLDKVGIDASLRGALPVALKEKPSSRGAFATQAVDFGEDALKKQIAALDAKIGSFDSEGELRAKAVADAEHELNAKISVHEGCMHQHADAKVVSKDMDAALTQGKKNAKALEPKGTKATASLEHAKAALQSILESADKFQELRAGMAQAVEAGEAVEAEVAEAGDQCASSSA